MAGPKRHALLRLWRPFRVVAGFVLVGVAVWVVAGKATELSGIGAFLSQPRWPWLVAATAAETASFMAMACLQRALLLAGGTDCRLRRVALITFAGNTIAQALPVGAGFAALFQFSQYQMVGADEVLAGWVVVATVGALFLAIAALAGVGLGMAASAGSALDLVEAIVGVIVVAALAGLVWSRRVQISEFAVKAVVAGERTLRRPAGQISGPLARGLERMRSVAPTKREWARALGWATTVWLADCSCWMFAFLAVGGTVPWRGLLLAYCAGQLAATLPITPGGLGVVEGTLTIALVAFGGGGPQTVAAVLLYRLLSFWIPLPIGAVCYAVLLRSKRRLVRAGLVTSKWANAASNGDAAGDGLGAGPVSDHPTPGRPAVYPSAQVRADGAAGPHWVPGKDAAGKDAAGKDTAGKDTAGKDTAGNG
jgi:hypothetical protein